MYFLFLHQYLLYIISYYQNNRRKHGLDSNISISYALKTLVNQQNWQKDEEVQACPLCNQEFTLFKRRHHCRRCGRIFCDTCCPKYSFLDLQTERFCLICNQVLTLDKYIQETKFQDLSAAMYLNNQQIMQVFKKNDIIMQSEVIRLFQNLCRNENVRKELIQHPEIFQTAKQLLEKCMKIQDVSRKQFFDVQDQQLDKQLASNIITNIVALLINFTASSNKQCIQFLTDNMNVLELCLPLLSEDYDLLRREQTMWLIKNLSVEKSIAKALSKNDKFIDKIQSLLKSNVKNIQESVYQTITNICKVNQSFQQQIIQLNILNLQQKDVEPLIYCAMLRLAGVLTQNDDYREQFLNNQVNITSIVKYIINYTVDKNQIQFKAEQNLKYCSCLDFLQNILLNSQENDDQLDFIIQQIFNTKFFVVIIERAQEVNVRGYISCQFLKFIFSGFNTELQELIASSKSCKKAFCETVTKILDNDKALDEQKAFTKSILKKLNKKDQFGLGKAINKLIDE